MNIVEFFGRAKLLETFFTKKGLNDTVKLFE